VSTPDSWEDFVELDATSIATDSTASAGTVQKRLRETLPIVINNVETVNKSVKAVAEDVHLFRTTIGSDLDQHENQLLQLRTEVGERPLELGASMVWKHIDSTNKTVCIV
jgi:hypothetical protein